MNAKTDTDKIYIDNPTQFTPGVAAHELVHQIQRQAGAQQNQPDTSSILAQRDGSAGRQQAYDSVYGYGGVQGLKGLPCRWSTMPLTLFTRHV
jgi:hypothetical protein